jgi:hypothetical protein
MKYGTGNQQRCEPLLPYEPLFFIPDPGSLHFSSRILHTGKKGCKEQGFFKNYLRRRLFKKISPKTYPPKFFIPDPAPGGKNAPDPGSRIPDSDLTLV